MVSPDKDGLGYNVMECRGYPTQQMKTSLSVGYKQSTGSPWQYTLGSDKQTALQIQYSHRYRLNYEPKLFNQFRGTPLDCTGYVLIDNTYKVYDDD